MGAAGKVFGPGDRVAVLLPLPLAGPYDYRVDAEQTLSAGDFVRVPLGKRRALGVVWGAGDGRLDEARCRSVLARLDAPSLPEATRRLVDWVAAYTLSPPGAVLKMAMSVPAALESTKSRRRPPPPLAAAAARPVLSDDQAAAAAVLRGQPGAGFAVTLLEGVTGSGKTEVYFEAVEAALAQGSQVLVLLPEIALSAQWLARFAARFGERPLIWHSEVSPAERRDGWRAVAAGTARVVVGARSALFLPFAGLGLIVVDEEHDGSYKQEDGVIYHARDMAVVRARIEAVPLVLASATPSLETQTNVAAGRYRRLQLPSRHGGATLPAVELVDLRRHPPPRQSWLSPPLLAAMEATLAAGEQVLLFLNRRGYAPLTVCRACGHRLQCPNCTAWLVDHRASPRLQCHHCGYISFSPETCPQCAAADSFAACGPGVERLAEEAQARFPTARLAVMASDTLPGPRAAAALVERMTAGGIDLLVGTQVAAKGHHFPLLTLVGVVDADLGLAGGDLRAAERTFQLMSQVAGRAGRAAHAGRVLLQTYQPDAEVMAALAVGAAERFYAVEADARRTAGMPPFGKLVAIVVSGPEAARAERHAALLAAGFPRQDNLILLGPAPAPLALLRGRHRHRLLLKAPRTVNVQSLLRKWLGAVPPPAGVRVQIDVDPYSFL
jgi:primosomal protein N' (replication factor Y)